MHELRHFLTSPVSEADHASHKRLGWCPLTHLPCHVDKSSSLLFPTLCMSRGVFWPLLCQKQARLAQEAWMVSTHSPSMSCGQVILSSLPNAVHEPRRYLASPVSETGPASHK